MLLMALESYMGVQVFDFWSLLMLTMSVFGSSEICVLLDYMSCSLMTRLQLMTSPTASRKFHFTVKPHATSHTKWRKAKGNKICWQCAERSKPISVKNNKIHTERSSAQMKNNFNSGDWRIVSQCQMACVDANNTNFTPYNIILVFSAVSQQCKLRQIIFIVILKQCRHSLL